MQSHHIALALADARVADLQRAATHRRATVPPRRHRRHIRALVLLGLAATTAPAALAPSGALARPIEDAATPANAHFEGGPAPNSTPGLRALAKTSSLSGTTSPPRQGLPSRAAALAAQTPQDLRSPDARDAAEGRGIDRTPRIVFVRVPPKRQPAPADGIAWADAGIGAGSALGLSLIAFGGALLITHRRRAAHATPPVAGL